MKHSIALQHGFAIFPSGRTDNTRMAASVQAELMNLGFMLDERAYRAACKASSDWLIEFHNEIIPYLRQSLGADKDYRPFYRNFPTQVMEMDQLELFVNAFIHYLSDGHWEPEQELKTRGIHFENTDFKTLKSGSEKDFKAIFTRLVAANTSLTPRDKETVAWFIVNQRDSLVMPDHVPFKETLCILAAHGLDVPVKSATDVLRVAVYLSGGDISLPDIPKVTVGEILPGRKAHFFTNLRAAQQKIRDSFKFKKFSRPVRRQILSLLEKTTLDLGDMQGRLGRWLRLGEILHVGEYAKKFPRTAAAFDMLRNQDERKVRTFHGRVNMAFAEHWKKGVDVLTERPGEFARKLDWLARTYDHSYVMDEFAAVGPKVSSKVLFELHTHFEARTKHQPIRSVMIKSARSKMKILEPLPKMDPIHVRKICGAIRGIIETKIAALPRLGSVWIDERLKNVPVPTAMRSVNTSIKTYIRGTRIPFRSDVKVIRPFIHWYDEHGQIDLDLSAGFYRESLELRSQISFTSLKDERTNCCHSGDIRRRKGPCAEYVDVDVSRCLEQGLRYVVMQVHNFDNDPLHAVKDCVFGLMERESAVEGEIFIPKTISNCTALANESSTVIICILDLKEKCYIWADLEAQSRDIPMFERTNENNLDVLKSLLYAPKMSIYELLSMHAEKRGSLVPSAVEADVKLKWDDFVSDYSRVASYMAF